MTAAGMGDAGESVAPMLRDVVGQLRTGDYGAAASGMNHALAAVQQAFRSGSVRQEFLQKLQYSIETMLLMQQQQDWVGLADVIEYEFLLLWERARRPQA